MRDELTRAGFEELRTPEAVDAAVSHAGTVLLVVNSVCGCAAGRARPGVLLALREAARRPDHLATVFAGMDVEATERARNHLTGYPPSSPSVALFRDGRLVHMMQRRDIENRDAPQIAELLREAFAAHCGEDGRGGQ
jgi:putative YphP/YqiW family bacilliredoxin